jgi:hypothetical protein
MELSPYIESLKQSLKAAAAPAGKDVADAAALLSQALEPSARLSFLEAMADAAAEITAALDGASVDARLHGRGIEFIVNEAGPPPAATVPPGPASAGETDDTARITLRLPESLKESVEQAASAAVISVNAWLVRAIAGAVSGGYSQPFSTGGHKPGRRFKGFARS